VPGFGAVLSTRHLALRLMIVNQLDPALRSRFVLHRAKTAAGLGREHRLYFLGLWVRRSIGAQYRRGNGDHGVLPIPFCGIYLTPVFLNVRFAPIALLNSKNGLQRFFREKSNQATIADRCVLKRATEVAGEVIASCCGPPRTIIRSPRPQPGKFVFSDPKRVLQH
jgi:hypothetical protein